MKHDEAITCCILFSIHCSGNCEQSRTDTRYELLCTMQHTDSEHIHCNIIDACGNVGDLRLIHNRGENFGAIQACRNVSGTEHKWRYFSSNGAWTEGAARLACRQLNLGYLSKRLQKYNNYWQILSKIWQMLQQVLWNWLEKYLQGK